MRATAYVLGGAALGCLMVACNLGPGTVPTGPGPADPTGSSSSDGVLSIAGRGGGGGQDRNIALTLTGGITSSSQPAVIDRETKSYLKILAGAEIAQAYADSFQLKAFAGFPAPGLPGCVVNPADAPAADVQRLIDLLDDPERLRDRVIIQIDVKQLGDPSTGNILNHNWTGGDGSRYRTWLKTSDLARDRMVTVEKDAVIDDVYHFTGGSIVNWDTSADVALICPNGGTITVGFTR